MALCPACGHDNPDGNKFCAECGAKVAGPAREAVEERKVVSVLFCDLAGFTAASESADPEDVDRVLKAYFAVARAAIEAFGGVVEKFIGDAVVGVFGVPAAHEDDPERAVRAGLRIVRDAERLTGIGRGALRLRVGINTGEALVTLGVSVAAGEGFLTGDAVNTASRIQSVAPLLGVGVGLATYEATSAVFEYSELEPAELKGKAEPVRVFHATAPQARLGTDVTRTHHSPFVGREVDLATLRGAFDETVAARSLQLVTVVGEPGLGKSRLVAELVAYADGTRDLIHARQGRCLPYGEGITFWALGEILKAHTGVLESDSPEVASEKLEAVLPEGPEREWFRQRLLPLLGIEASSPADREELFTAWRRFLEHVAADRPTVLVFEDLHWADEAMLAFIEHLASHAEQVPLLLVCTARPELYARHPGYGAGLTNSTPVKLAPLSREETAELVSGLLETTVLPAELQQPILDRAGGNPLFAQEFVRLLKDRDLLVQDGSSWRLREGPEVPFPMSVQALIAARLDTLEPDVKSLLADAAVVGRVFWAGAIATMGSRDDGAVSATLAELTRREFVWPGRSSSMAGEAEYAFGHVLVRDVVYGQLPRPARIARHVAAARWLEAKVSGRVEDIADVLAYHYATALELARAAGQSERAVELEAPALRFLILAGERALGLDTAAAVASFERALTLSPPGHPERPRALALFGEAAKQAGRPSGAAEALEEAIELFRAAGDLRAAARATVTLSALLLTLADSRRATLMADMLTLLEPLEPGPELVPVLGEMSCVELGQGRPEAARAYAERALAVAEQFGLGRPPGILYHLAGARRALGDSRAIDDYREAIALATAAGLGTTAAAAYTCLGATLNGFVGHAAAVKAYHEAVAFAEPRGLDAEVPRSNIALSLASLGELDEALELYAGIAERAERTGAVSRLVSARRRTIGILLTRGEADRIEPGWIDWLESQAGEGKPARHNVGCLSAAANARAALGQRDSAVALLPRIAALPDVAGELEGVLPPLVRTALGLGEHALARDLVALVEASAASSPRIGCYRVAARAALAESDREHRAAAAGYAEAAEGWQRFASPVDEHALALLGWGRCLIALDRPAEALARLEQARKTFFKLRAMPALAEADLLLHRVGALPPERV